MYGSCTLLSLHITEQGVIKAHKRGSVKITEDEVYIIHSFDMLNSLLYRKYFPVTCALEMVSIISTSEEKDSSNVKS